MQHKIKSVVGALIVGLIIPFAALAGVSMPVASDGGILVGSKKDPFWFEIGGVVKLDQRSYWGETDKANVLPNQNGSYPGTYQSGSTIRDLAVELGGGLGTDFSYFISLNFDAHASKSKVDDAYVTYAGFRDYLPNLTFSFGQVSPGFCIACASSSKWIPFLERSMEANTFGPQLGMGVNANTFNNNYSLNVAVTQQPQVGTQVYDPAGNPIKTHDLWQGSGRLTYAPIAEPGKLAQIGVSAHIEEGSNTGFQFDPAPEMRSGNSTTLLNTTQTFPGLKAGSYIYKRVSVRNQKTGAVEFTGILGPWSGEAEYQRTFITRGLTIYGTPQGQNLHFYGYHAQVSYVLTGESRPHKKSNGTLGQILPKSKLGAWEVSARYSTINLNSKDVTGGSAKNFTASISWYANDHIRVIAEWVNSKQQRQFIVPALFDKRTVNSIGARLQAAF